MHILILPSETWAKKCALYMAKYGERPCSLPCYLQSRDVEAARVPITGEWAKSCGSFTRWEASRPWETEILPFVTAWTDLESSLLSETRTPPRPQVPRVSPARQPALQTSDLPVPRVAKSPGPVSHTKSRYTDGAVGQQINKTPLYMDTHLSTGEQLYRWGSKRKKGRDAA